MAPGGVTKITVVEDDHSIGEAMCAALVEHGYASEWHTSGRAATIAFDREVPDLVLLDAGLPDIDGFTLCRRLREAHRDLPILLVTARDDDIDIIVGLDAGANDYITKPFSMNVLLARVRAHLRSAETATADSLVTVGGLTIDPAAFAANCSGVPVDLRPREFQLLVYLARRAGRVVTRDRLLADIWDVHWDTSTKTIDMHVLALRRKLGPTVEITAIRGVGYRLELP